MLVPKSSWALALILSVSLFAASAQAAIGKSGNGLRKQAVPVKQSIRKGIDCPHLDGNQHADAFGHHGDASNHPGGHVGHNEHHHNQRR